jgi:hypothetical protein
MRRIPPFPYYLFGIREDIAREKGVSFFILNDDYFYLVRQMNSENIVGFVEKNIFRET